MVDVLARPFDMSLPAVSSHLKVLERAGLITRVRVTQHRPVRLEPKGFDEIAEWLDRYGPAPDQRQDGPLA